MDQGPDFQFQHRYRLHNLLLDSSSANHPHCSTVSTFLRLTRIQWTNELLIGHYRANWGLSTSYTWGYIAAGGTSAADVNFIIGQKFLENYASIHRLFWSLHSYRSGALANTHCFTIVSLSISTPSSTPPTAVSVCLMSFLWRSRFKSLIVSPLFVYSRFCQGYLNVLQSLYQSSKKIAHLCTVVRSTPCIDVSIRGFYCQQSIYFIKLPHR